MTTDTLQRPADTAHAILDRLRAGEPMDAVASRTLFGALIEGKLDDPEIEAMLRALPVRAETAAEMTGAARALRAAA